MSPSMNKSFKIKINFDFLISDLVPKEIVDKWLKYLRNEFPTIAFKASTQSQKQNLVSKFCHCSVFLRLFESSLFTPFSCNQKSFELL